MLTIDEEETSSEVVSKMGFATQFTDVKSKIPEYAKDYKNEWLYIRGINKKCGELLKILVNNTDSFEKVFWSSRPKELIKHFENVLEAQNISDFYFKYNDINNIEILEEQLDNCRDLYVDPDSYEFDKESYDLNIDIDYPGFRELFNLITLFNDKIKKEEPIFNFILESDSELDNLNESESDDDF